MVASIARVRVESYSHTLLQYSRGVDSIILELGHEFHSLADTASTSAVFPNPGFVCSKVWLTTNNSRIHPHVHLRHIALPTRPTSANLTLFPSGSWWRREIHEDCSGFCQSTTCQRWLKHCQTSAQLVRSFIANDLQEEVPDSAGRP